MALQNGLFTLALSALLLAPVAAKAEDMRFGATHEATPVGPARVEQHSRDYRPAPPPPPMPERSRWPRQHGRYELQTVQKQLPGHYEQIWVERTCMAQPRRYETRCVPAHSEQRWVPGFTQTVQEWVWIAAPSRYGRG